MRDQRFIAVHRGGPLAMMTHRRLAGWAADCAERLLPLFERCYDDDRPRQAIDVCRAWARGEVKTGAAQKASVAAHAAARAASDPAAIAAARAAGHAVATAHFAEHCLGTIIYGRKAIIAANGDAAAELAWQLDQLPSKLRALIVSALKRRKMIEPAALHRTSQSRQCKLRSAR